MGNIEQKHNSTHNKIMSLNNIIRTNHNILYKEPVVKQIDIEKSESNEIKDSNLNEYQQSRGGP